MIATVNTATHKYIALAFLQLWFRLKRVTLIMDDEMHVAVKVLAAKSQRSMNDLMIEGKTVFTAK